ncbi:hypothetical protein [Variovorax rhizosphaerae]|uniref:Uncharacterized protein n=1 Tax=Variovorax rhizosphaerae TaxID=1836200 RepID=A0ABU8WHA1_9BURK
MPSIGLVGAVLVIAGHNNPHAFQMSSFDSEALVWIGFAVIAAAIGIFLWRIGREDLASRAAPRIVSVDALPAGRISPPVVPMMTVGKLHEELEHRSAAWTQERERLQIEEVKLSQLDYLRMDPRKLLTHASEHERANLAAVLGLPRNVNAEVMEDAVRRAGSHSAASWWRGASVDYEEVARDVAKKMGVRNIKTGESVEVVERLAVEALFNKRLSKASPKEREEILAQFGGSRGGASVATAAGGLVLANLSGFALYTAASSALAGITGAIGLTLPFAAYTGMSSALAAVTGPVGWIALGLFAVVKIGGVDFKQTVPAVLAIAAARARLSAERQQALDTLSKAQKRQLIEEARIARLRTYIGKNLAHGTSFEVPQSQVPR